MIYLETLILRKCSIFGVIPDYITNMTKIEVLDLSYNNLTGNFPKTFDQLSMLKFMYLTGNKLTGTLPAWLLASKKNIDLSNNTFTWEEGSPKNCLHTNINAMESFKSSLFTNYYVEDSCLLQSLPCLEQEKSYMLHINCGGSEISDALTQVTYEADLEGRGASTTYSTKHWALSNTGNFIGNDKLKQDEVVHDYDYIRTNTSALKDEHNNTMGLYETARNSPLSLTYYARCMIDGNYTVGLHFAEIIFVDDGSVNSLGKRIFDVYLQDELVLKDFNIQDEAGGSGIVVVKNFTVEIRNNTLTVHLYWAGKGTIGIPIKGGSYGPLISAISVDPNFEPPSNAFELKSKSKEIIRFVVIIIGAILAILLIIGIIIRRRVMGRRTSVATELRQLNLQSVIISLDEIKVATRNFDATNKIGEGVFGSVYKGTLPDGSTIAVKQLSSTSRQGNIEFVTEVGLLSGLQHPNLVKLHGCCIEGAQMLLIYEYLENNSVHRVLFGHDSESNITLDWTTRRKICLGVARGLVYLHEESPLKMIHRDIKPSNILLDNDLNAKISDFGLAKLLETDHSHISTRIGGTLGYMAPEYALYGRLSTKADVYSFGVVVLEIVSGKRNTNFRPIPTEDFVTLSAWALTLQTRGVLHEMVDPGLMSEYVVEEALVLLKVALLCTRGSPDQRPTMSQVVHMVEGSMDVPDLLDPGPSAPNNNYFDFSDPSSSASVGTSLRRHPSQSNREESSLLQDVDESDAEDFHTPNASEGVEGRLIS